MIKTKHLTLTTTVPHDNPFQSNTQFIGDNVEYLVGSIQSKKSTSAHFYIYLTGNNQLVGEVEIVPSLLESPTAGELGIEILEPYQRNGFAFEACQALMVDVLSKQTFSTIYYLVASNNYPSIHLATKLGFMLQETAQIEMGLFMHNGPIQIFKLPN